MLDLSDEETCADQVGSILTTPEYGQPKSELRRGGYRSAIIFRIVG